MRFSRIQIILTFLCLATLGLSIGFLATGVPTVTPLFFLIFLIILGITFISGIGNAWTHVRSEVRHTSPHIQNFGSVIGRNAKSLSQSVWAAVKQGAEHASPHVRSWTSSLYDAVSSNTKAFKDWGIDKVRKSPYFWCGIASSCLAFYFFGEYQITKTWRHSHVSGMFVYIALLFFVTHYNWWDTVSEFITKHKAGVWLTASSVWLALAYEHHWSLWWPGISTALAVIVYFEWTEPIKEAVTKKAKQAGSGLLKLLTGGYGWGISCIVYAVIFFIWGEQMFVKLDPLTGKQLDIALNLAIAIAILLILGPILVGEKALRKKKDKEKG